MKSINCYHTTTPLHWSSNARQYSLPCGSNFARNNFYLPLLVNPARTKSSSTMASMGAGITSSVVLAVNSPATTGDLSVLIPTSAVFLFLYWIANFVVPEFVVKDLESQDASKERSQNEKESITLSRTTNSEPKKKGFQSTK
uniref:uncharacterized protein LOC122609889 n=1 Tax=Erigeron canadensis TaxID=72917 RepID=UPI001CB8C457|nr:uncharacterized protein LOC122609889 [Erigeron canadensis]